MPRKTSIGLDKLQAQISNQTQYPNIQQQNFQSLQRDLQLYWQRTYGLRVLEKQNNKPLIAYLLVLAVHGQKLPGNQPNKNENTNKNAIFLANHFLNFKPGTKLLLNTPENPNVTVTVQACIGNGAFQVAEPLTLDIEFINKGGTTVAARPSVKYVAS